MEQQEKEILDEFRKLVNMTPKALEDWLDTEESKEVGFKEDGKGESVGHQSGKKIVSILRKKQADYTTADLEHMKKVSGYIKRHLAQKPSGDVSETPWRYSLKNWGHDPVK